MEKKSLANLTILYVEDDTVIRQVTTNSLELFDANVIQASDGEEGIKQFEQHKDEINIILTDIKMPKMDGLEMSHMIRKNDQEIPIIISTAHEETNFLKTSIELNISAYVLKPIDIYKLFDSIKKAIEPRLLKQQLIHKNKQLQNEIKKNKEKHQIMMTQSRFASMGELINMIAHQWRQPLASIGTAAFNLQFKLDSKSYDLDSQESQEKHIQFFSKKLKEIEYYVQNLTSTIDDFRNFYKSDKSSSKVSTKQLIEDALKILSYSFNERAITVNKEFNSTSIVNIYPNEIVHVLINIFKNSQDNFLEHNIDNMEINIKTYETKEYTVIEISDNGGGIPKEICEKVFDPYFSTKKEKNGTGLGLYMSKIIIEKHHKGELTFNNTQEGVCFNIKLPL